MYTGQTNYYKVKNPNKYVGNPDNVVYRSSWERKFMIWADKCESVIKWGSEELYIPYIHPVDKKPHRYFIDFFCIIKDSNGNLNKYLIEIKPEKFTKFPVMPKRKSKRYLDEIVQYETNKSKFAAAEEFCKVNGLKFIILTEKHLGI
jgi:hypothetical protein